MEKKFVRKQMTAITETHTPPKVDLTWAKESFFKQ